MLLNNTNRKVRRSTNNRNVIIQFNIKNNTNTNTEETKQRILKLIMTMYLDSLESLVFDRAQNRNVIFLKNSKNQKCNTNNSNKNAQNTNRRKFQKLTIIVYLDSSEALVFDRLQRIKRANSNRTRTNENTESLNVLNTKENQL